MAIKLLSKVSIKMSKKMQSKMDCKLQSKKRNIGTGRVRTKILLPPTQREKEKRIARMKKLFPGKEKMALKFSRSEMTRTILRTIPVFFSMPEQRRVPMALTQLRKIIRLALVVRRLKI